MYLGITVKISSKSAMLTDITKTSRVIFLHVVEIKVQKFCQNFIKFSKKIQNLQDKFDIKTKTFKNNNNGKKMK